MATAVAPPRDGGRPPRAYLQRFQAQNWGMSSVDVPTWPPSASHHGTAAFMRTGEHGESQRLASSTTIPRDSGGNPNTMWEGQECTATLITRGRGVHLDTARATAHVRKSVQTPKAKATAALKEMRLPSFNMNSFWMKKINSAGSWTRELRPRLVRDTGALSRLSTAWLS